MTDYFRDEFTGSGTYDGHTPDVGSVTFPAVCFDDALVSTADSGDALSLFGGVLRYDCTSGVSPCLKFNTPPSQDFIYTVVIEGDPTQSPSMYLMMVTRVTGGDPLQLASVYLVVSFFADELTLETRCSYNGGTANVTLDTVALAAGLQDIEIKIAWVDMQYALYANGVLVIVVNPFLDFSGHHYNTGDCYLFPNISSGGTRWPTNTDFGKIGIKSVSITSPAPTPFWTSYVTATEFDA